LIALLFYSVKGRKNEYVNKTEIKKEYKNKTRRKRKRKKIINMFYLNDSTNA
jgi:hypothetical protein